MIPAYNCGRFLPRTIASVLAQAPDEKDMQIEVVDDCSPDEDLGAIVADLGRGRVLFHRKSENGGITANFNTCIERSRGHLIHILHGDDTVLPGFYRCIKEMAAAFPDTAFFATRQFYVDEEDVITGVGMRIPEMENPTHDARRFFYDVPIQTPGVVIRRSFYETQGGFLPSLKHTADWEMWSRAISLGGGLISKEVLTSYRIFQGSDTNRLAKTAENLREMELVANIFTDRFDEFDLRTAMDRFAERAISQADRFHLLNDPAAVAANLSYWRKNASISARIRHALRGGISHARKLFG